MLLPPLASLQAEVTLLFELRWQRAGSFEELAHLLASGLKGGVSGAFFLALPFRSTRHDGRVIAGDEVLVRILTGDNGSEAGAAEAAGHIAAFEGKALAGEAVEMRRLHHGMAHEAVVAPQMIVGDDHDDVRRRIGGPERGDGEEAEKQEADHGAA